MRKLALAVLVLLFAAAAFAGDARVRVTLKPEVVDIDAAARELAETYAAKLVKVEDGNVILELSIARSGLVARDPHVAAVTVLGSVDAAPVSRPAALRPSAVLTPRANNTCTPPGLPCSTGTYEYDGSGNIKRIGNDVFVYDELNRLKTATLPSAGGVGETYIYDGFGNMQSVTATPAEGRPDVTTNKATNHLSEAGYDGAGNVSSWPGHTYKYDAANMLVEMVETGGEHVAYVYTADDERIAVLEIVTGGYNGTWRIRGLDNKVLREFAESNGSWTWTRDYLYRGGQLLTSFAGAPGGAERRYDYHLDHLGTPRLITDASGRKVSAHNYYPFGGEITWNEGINETFTFTGHERDSSLTTTSQNHDYWYYMHARYDSPNLSRFLSVDPAGRHKATARPQAWNRYVYASNNPLVRIDPDGLRDIYVALWQSRVLSGSFGHAAAFELSGKAILSQFPDPHAPRGRNVRLTYAQTIAAEGRIPDYVYRVHVPNDKAFDEAVSALVSPRTRFWSWLPVFSNETNCSVALAEALSAGGIPLLLFGFPEILPDDLIAWFDQVSSGTEENAARQEQLGGISSFAVRNDILSPNTGSTEDLLRRMHEFDWLYKDAFGTEIVVTRN